MFGTPALCYVSSQESNVIKLCNFHAALEDLRVRSLKKKFDFCSKRHKNCQNVDRVYLFVDRLIVAKQRKFFFKKKNQKTFLKHEM